MDDIDTAICPHCGEEIDSFGEFSKLTKTKTIDKTYDLYGDEETGSEFEEDWEEVGHYYYCPECSAKLTKAQVEKMMIKED